MFPHFYTLYATSTVSVYFEEMNTFEIIDMKYSGNQETQRKEYMLQNKL